MSWGAISAFAQKHEESLGLFALAMAVTMAPKLPWPFYKLEALEWTYEWVRRGLLTFVSFRGPAHSETSVQVSKDGKTSETNISTESSDSSTAAKPPAEAPPGK